MHTVELRQIANKLIQEAQDAAAVEVSGRLTMAAELVDEAIRVQIRNENRIRG